MAEGVDYRGRVKTIHKGVCLDILENLMKDWMGGSHLVMNITPIVPVNRPLMAIVCTYISQNVLWFISKEGAGRTVPGVPYLSLYPSNYYNVSI